jgi:HEAT repeat protein
MAILALWELEPSDEVSMAADEEFLATASKDAIADAIESAALVGEGAVPYCIKCLDRPSLTRAAAVVLGKIGPEAADAVPALLKQVNNEEAVVRREVLFALGKIGPAAKDAVPAALACVDDPDAAVRYSAVYSLGRIGPDAAAATERLLKELDSEDRYYATCCAMSLVRIDPGNSTIVPRVLPLLMGALRHDDSSVRTEAASTLGMLGPKARPGLNALKNAAYDQSPIVRRTVADAIAKIAEA